MTSAKMPGLTVLRVFVGDDGRGGNPLGVFLDGGETPRPERQGIARELNYSETVFVDDRERGELEIYTPANLIPFAGHPLVGTAWLLEQEGLPVETLRPPAGEVGVRRDGELTFIQGDPDWTIDFEYLQQDSPEDVDSFTGAPEGVGAAYCWAWIDEEAGIVRARSFVPMDGIEEDEATGSAALTLSARVGRSLEIHQGEGSLLNTRLLGGGRAEVGGRVERVS
jgi:predicted PhzF superfamily epimerase YddE/YHI9